MTKISSKSAYPIKNPVIKDYFVGTDSENSNKTVNFDFESVAKLINQQNGTSTLDYLFKTDFNIELSVLTEGVFLTNENKTDISEITTLYVNRKNHSGVDLIELYQFIKINKVDFIIELRRKDNLNNTVYWSISDVHEFQDHFVFDVDVYKSNPALTDLSNFGVYFFNFELNPVNLVVDLPEYNKFTVDNGFTISGQNITINPLSEWLLKNVHYSNPSSIPLNAPLASAGKQRIDLIVANAFNGFQVVSGTESEINPVKPIKLNNTIEYTFYLVNDSSIVEIPPADLSDYATIEYVDNSFENKVDKVIGYSLTKNDLTDLLKSAYDNAVNWILTNGTNLLNHLTRTDNPHNVTKAQIGLGDVDNTSDISKPVSTAQAAADASVLTSANSYTDSKVSSVYKFRGNVADYASLPSTGLTIGDVYNLLDTGANYAWTGTVWDNIGTTVDISGKENVVNKTNTILGNETSTTLYSSIKGIVDYFENSLFTPITENQYGIHPSFSNQSDLNAFLLGRVTSDVVTLSAPDGMSVLLEDSETTRINWNDTNS